MPEAKKTLLLVLIAALGFAHCTPQGWLNQFFLYPFFCILKVRNGITFFVYRSFLSYIAEGKYLYFQTDKKTHTD